MLSNLGEMSLQQQEEHFKSEAAKWLSTGKLDLTLSIFLCNGRYEVAAYILPTKSVHALRLGFEALKALKGMLQLKANIASVLDKTWIWPLSRTIKNESTFCFGAHKQSQSGLVVEEGADVSSN